MSHEHDHDRDLAKSRAAATNHDNKVEPGQSSRSALLRKPEHATASGLVQRKASDPSGAASQSSDDVQSRLGTGSSLPADTQATMSEHLGGDFSDVKIHTDSSAAVLCKEMNAKAFTIGTDVAFGAGQYQPGTAEGDGLIAHELTHTIQQKQGRTTQLSGLGGDPGTRNALEQEADNNAAKIQRKAETGGDTGGLEAEADAAGAKVAGKSKGGKDGASKDDPNNEKKLKGGGEKPKVKLVGTSGEQPPPVAPTTGGGLQRKAIQLGGDPPTSVDILGAVVNTAQAAWDIVKDNRPQQTIGTKFCNAVPQNVPWNELYGWRTHNQTWHVVWENWAGVDVLDANFTITYQWRGQTDQASGWFLNNYTIYANNCSVAWGWTVNVNAGVSGDAFNSGTRDFPIGAVPLLMTVSRSSVLASDSYTDRYTANGGGGSTSLDRESNGLRNHGLNRRRILLAILLTTAAVAAVAVLVFRSRDPGQAPARQEGTMEEPHHVDVSAGLVYQLLWSPSSKHAVSLSREDPNAPGQLELYETARWGRVRAWAVAITPETTSIAWSGDGARVAAITDERTIQVLSIEEDRPVGIRQLSGRGVIMRIAWHPSDNVLAAAFFPHEGTPGVPHVALWSGDAEEPTAVVPLRSEPGGTFAWAGWSPSGKHLGIIFTKQITPTFQKFDNALILLELTPASGLEPMAERKLPGGTIGLERSNEGWSSDGRRFATAFFDEQGGGIAFLDPLEGRAGPVWRPEHPNTLVRGATWAPGASYVATTDGQYVFVISADKGEIIRQFPSRFAASPERFTETRPTTGPQPVRVGIAGITMVFPVGRLTPPETGNPPGIG